MSDQRENEKIDKLLQKKKSAGIIKLMGKADEQVLAHALTALGEIGDEDASNQVTHYLDHPDKEVRVAACRAALHIGTEYMKTRVGHQLAMETDPETKKRIQEAFNTARQ